MTPEDMRRDAGSIPATMDARNAARATAVGELAEALSPWSCMQDHFIKAIDTYTRRVILEEVAELVRTTEEYAQPPMEGINIVPWSFQVKDTFYWDGARLNDTMQPFDPNWYRVIQVGGFLTVAITDGEDGPTLLGNQSRNALECRLKGGTFKHHVETSGWLDRDVVLEHIERLVHFYDDNPFDTKRSNSQQIAGWKAAAANIRNQIRCLPVYESRQSA